MDRSIGQEPNIGALIRGFVARPSRQTKLAIQRAVGLSANASISAVLDADYKARAEVSTCGVYEERPAYNVGEVRKLIPAKTASFSEPVCLTGHAPEKLTTHFKKPKHSPAVRLYKIARKGCAVSYYKGIPICFSGDSPRAVAPDISGRHYEAVYHYGGKRQWASPSIDVDDIIVIHDRFVGNNYCHWLLDWFVRAIVLLDIDPPSTAYVALPRRPTSFMVECLAKIGIDETRLLYSKDRNEFSSSTFSAKRLWASSSSNADWRHGLHYGADWAFRRLRRILYNGKTQSRSIILQRRDFRRLALSANALEILAREGFQTVYLEDLSMNDQIEIFAGAERVIAAHGAGMANITFCPEGANILEIFPPMHATPVYWIVANAARLRYTCAIGDMQKNARARMPTDHDISCPTDVIERWLENVI